MAFPMALIFKLGFLSSVGVPCPDWDWTYWI